MRILAEKREPPFENCGDNERKHSKECLAGAPLNDNSKVRGLQAIEGCCKMLHGSNYQEHY